MAPLMFSLALAVPEQVREFDAVPLLAEWDRQYLESRRRVRPAGVAAEGEAPVPSRVFVFSDGRRVLVSEEAVALILRFEVTSAAYYERALQHGHVPHGDRSGVTVGLGFDLGQHSPRTIRAAFLGKLPPAEVARLCALAGLRGEEARGAFAKMEKVSVPLPVAQAVFSEWMLPETVAQTVRIFPEVKTLHPHAAGALVSLVFNRGSALPKQNGTGENSTGGTDRRQGMANIKTLLAAGDGGAVPEEIRRMKTLALPNEGGLVARREAEAALFGRGFDAQASQRVSGGAGD